MGYVRLWAELNLNIINAMEFSFRAATKMENESRIKILWILEQIWWIFEYMIVFLDSEVAVTTIGSLTDYSRINL